MPANQFLIDSNISSFRRKTLPFYETCILNYGIRSRAQPNKVIEYYYESNALRNQMLAGNLWTTIKSWFKRGKNALSKTMDFIDSNPLTSTLKDMAFDYIGEKTGVDPSQYYNLTKDITHMNYGDPSIKDITRTVVDHGTKYLQNQYNQYKQNKSDPNYKPTPIKNKIKQQFTKDGIKNNLNTIYQQVRNAVPESYKSQVDSNFSLFGNGLCSDSAGANLTTAKMKTLMNNIPKMLLLAKHKSSGGVYIPGHLKDVLSRFNIKTTTIPKVISELPFINSVKTIGEELARVKKPVVASTGRLYQGRGVTELSGSTKSGSSKSSRYQDIINKLAKK